MSLQLDIATEGRCVMHNPDVTIPATHLLEVPIGNVLPLCTPCLEWWVQDAKETGDRYSQPVSIRPTRPVSEPPTTPDTSTRQVMPRQERNTP